jgi:S1-C subfamily serine protease
MITISIFTYMLLIRQELNYNILDKKITDLKLETQSNVNSLSEGLIETKSELESQLGIVQGEFDILKASAGEDFSGIIETSVPSVVTIRTDVSQGTGFIIDSEGYVVTNFHVVDGATAATIITYDYEDHQVSLIGSYPDLDIALLKISGTYDALELGNSNDIQVGERVIAIGNPLGLQFSVSQGIVSAVHRTGPNGLPVYVQTDAALNPGNSGGPLINTRGKVIGINNFKAGDSESLGFALESNYIKDAVNDIYRQSTGGVLI